MATSIHSGAWPGQASTTVQTVAVATTGAADVIAPKCPMHPGQLDDQRVAPRPETNR
jgi:hypothetical protein